LVHSRFIGGQIARAALARGWRVRPVRRRPGAVGAIGDLSVAWAQADLRDRAALVEAMRGCAVVFHAAASYPQGSRNLEQAVAEVRAEMMNVLDAARATGVARLIYTSSLTTLARRYVPGMAPLDKRDVYAAGAARSAYYEAKLAMEQIALTARDLDVVVLLPTAVFGPGDVKPTTSLVIREAGRGRIPLYFDAVDGRDVATAHLAAAEARTSRRAIYPRRPQRDPARVAGGRGSLSGGAPSPAAPAARAPECAGPSERRAALCHPA
jgi:dihydroflavonol-4-reductase